jgi:hypothetical protein
VDVPAFHSAFRIQEAARPNEIFINIPARGVDENVEGAIARDEDGQLWILRQGALRPNSVLGQVTLAEFHLHTALSNVDVSPAPNNSERQYYAVACPQEIPEIVRNQTAAFVLECDRVRRRRHGSLTPAEQLTDPLAQAFESAEGRPETVTSFWRRASVAREIIRNQTRVWQALKRRFGARLTNPRVERLGTDALISRHGASPLLVEIKTSTRASSIHEGLGQLIIYGDLYRSLPNSTDVIRVLLVPDNEPVRSALVQVFTSRQIIIHTYTDGDPVIFSREFLALADASGP